MGFCLFSLSSSSGSKALASPDLHKHFATPAGASDFVKLHAIHRFTSAAEAVQDAAEIGEGKVSKSLKKFLAKELGTGGDDEGDASSSGKKLSKKSKKAAAAEQLVVVDPKLGGAISKKLGIDVISDSSVLDLYRGIRSNLATLLGADTASKSGDLSASGSLDPRDLNTMSLGLSHSLSRYKLKFSPDKVDTMVVQAIGLLDDLDKEVNIYAMRVKEWYGWHFPEMGKILTDNIAYAKCIQAMGFRTGAATADLSEILPEEIEETLKAAAEISMGTEISETDLSHIQSLCEQVISISAYRAQLYAYLQNRMNTIAPNLTALVGELVGARLISHAGSLMHLAKQPASTVQILGAEKALFRALKTKHDTPKYGLLYHASLVGQAPNKLKGKMARMVATKAALSIRLDALADGDTKAAHSTEAGSDEMAVDGGAAMGTGRASIGAEARLRLEAKLRAMENGAFGAGLKGVNNGFKQKAYTPASAAAAPANGAAAGRSYNAGADATSTAVVAGKKRGAADSEDEGEEAEELSKEEKKARKKAKKEAKAAAAGDVSVATTANGGELSKEERKAAKKAAKKAAAAGDVSVATTANGGEAAEAEAAGDESKKLSKEERKALKKAKKEGKA